MAASASASAEDVSGGFVTISVERLRALEAMAKSYDAERFRILREKDKANPEAHAKRTQKYYEAHKDEINARRREKRRLAKEAAAEAKKTPGLG